jgi:putative colanic acid biosynthesis acetyltransferase WcaF
MTRSKSELDIQACRARRPYTRKEYLARFLWTMIKPLFCFSPRMCFGFRASLLRIFGAKVGRDVHVYPSAVIYMPWLLTIEDEASIGEWALIYNLGPIVIGKQATISHRAHLCAGTHEYEREDLTLIRAPITIESGVWVCTDAYIGPGVTLGEGCVVGARAVVVKSVSAFSVVGGNPARFLKYRSLGEPIQ